MKHILALAGALIFTGICFCQPVVKTNAGLVSGMVTRNGSVQVFKGIPFAAPPVGELQFKPPQPVAPWTGIKKCEAFGPSPMQSSPAPFSMWTQEFLIPAEPISEDCLYLNVWTSSVKNKKPVLVWIYGGGFQSGGSAVPIYDGEAMALKNVVFVSINYRVGDFGFKGGNWGLMDQIAALKWVRENIEAFGGDKNNVTIAGQSAGGVSVACLIASPLAKGLFSKAIIESGRLMRDRGKFGPMVDSVVLFDTPYNIFAAAKQNKVALIVGANQDEDSAYIKNANTMAMLQSHVAPVYVYRFTRKLPATGEYVKYGSFHTGEVPYAYNNLRFVNRAWEPVDHQLANSMNAYWVNFITSGNPNGKGLPTWTAYTNNHKSILYLGERIQSK